MSSSKRIADFLVISLQAKAIIKNLVWQQYQKTIVAAKTSSFAPTSLRCVRAHQHPHSTTMHSSLHNHVAREKNCTAPSTSMQMNVAHLEMQGATNVEQIGQVQGTIKDVQVQQMRQVSEPLRDADKLQKKQIEDTQNLTKQVNPTTLRTKTPDDTVSPQSTVNDEETPAGPPQESCPPVPDYATSKDPIPVKPSFQAHVYYTST
jgi:hypothetical protein